VPNFSQRRHLPIFTLQGRLVGKDRAVSTARLRGCPWSPRDHPSPAPSSAPWGPSLRGSQPQPGAQVRSTRAQRDGAGGAHETPVLPPPFGLSFSVSPFIYSSFHVSVFSLLHAMAVVLHADETVRGTTAGSHFSGNF